MRRLIVAGALAAAMVGCGPKVAERTIIANPKIQFVVWGQQAPDAFRSDWNTLCANGVMDRLSEYGVIGCSVLSPIVAKPDLQPEVFVDSWVVDEMLSEITPDKDTVYVVVLPWGSSTWYARWSGFRAYHFWAEVTFAITIPDETIISHEIYEATTNPWGTGVLAGNQEIGDPCESQIDVIQGLTVQKVWSIRAAQCL